jgi:hypothetical protein
MNSISTTTDCNILLIEDIGGRMQEMVRRGGGCRRW